jgi:hypothetical protein
LLPIKKSVGFRQSLKIILHIAAMFISAAEKRESVALSLETKQQFERHYPTEAFPFEHRLAFNYHMLIETLCDVMPRLRPETIEWRNSGDSKDGDFNLVRTGADGALQHIRELDDKPGWLMLSGLHELPEYKTFFHKIVEEFVPDQNQREPLLATLRGFVFISGPRTVTPLHFDPEYNLFFQLRGEKRFTYLPPTPPYLTDQAQEHYYRTGKNMLDWSDEFDAAATHMELGVGDGLYLPFGSPHWVTVLSLKRTLSLSLTWSTDWAMENAHVHGFNGTLRRFGLRPKSPTNWPDRNPYKAFAGRALGRLGLA